MSEIIFLRFDDLDVIILWMIIQLYHFTYHKKWRAKTYKRQRKHIISSSVIYHHKKDINTTSQGHFGSSFSWEIWYYLQNGSTVARNKLYWLGSETESPEIHQDSPVLFERIEPWGPRGPQFL